MAFQLVYTSAAKLLDAGRSGYGTVARSKSITPLVVSAIERVSQFANLRGLDRTRVIHVHRRITAGSNRFHILTRIVDAGADYTGRTNHLAHHLVVSQEEAARAAVQGITPADVLRQFPWLDRWDAAARFFDATEDVPLENFRPDGKNSNGQFWAAITGNPAHARLLSWDVAPRTGVLVVPENVDTLHMLAEALAEFGQQSWTRSFTTSLETTDELSELEWIVTTPAAFPEIQSRCGSRTLFDLTQPGTLPTPPAQVIPAPQITLVPDPSGSGTTTPGENPIRIKLADKGSRDASAAVSRSNPKQDQKTQIKLLVGFAALIFVAGLVVFLAIKDQTAPAPKADAITQQASEEPRLTDQQEQAARDLINSGIKKPEADLLVRTAGEDAKKWANFVQNTNNVLNGFNHNFTPDDINKLPQFNLGKEPAGGPSWIESLVSGTEQLRKVPNLKAESIVAQDFVDLANAIDNLNIVLSNGYVRDRPPTKPNREELFDKIALPWLTGMIKLKKFNELEGILNLPDIWDKSKFPTRHQLLETIIDDAFNKEKNPTLDHKRLFGLLGKTQKFDEQLKRIMPANADGTESPDHEKANIFTSSHPNMAEVPAKEIILVSREDIKRGVEVRLLKAVMIAKLGSETIKVKGLKFEVNGVVEDLDSLVATENHFSKYNSKIAFQIYKDGKFAISKDDVDQIDIGFPDKAAVILVDEASAAPYDHKLHFTLGKTGENSVQVGGTLTKRIDEVMPVTVRDSLKITIQPETLKTLEIQRCDDRTWKLTREADIPRSIILPEEEAASVKELLAAYSEAAAATGNTKEDKKKNAEARKTALSKLKEQMDKSFKADQLESLLQEQKLTWTELEKESTGRLVVENCILTILKNTAKPEARPSLEQEIKSIRTLSVRTPNGRVLFRADPNR